MDLSLLGNVSYNCLLDLSSELGINASSREELFGCIFGRDSAITILKILKVVKSNHPHFDRQTLLNICRRTLLTLVSLQGQANNIESGEEVGKFIHEYRPDQYERFVACDPPWYIYPDGSLKNYDSLDATPLILIALYRYVEVSNDLKFLDQVMPAINLGLQWLMTDADKDQDGLIEYAVSPERQHAGLSVQSWTDSRESIAKPDGSIPIYPIAPVEVQGYVWLALRLWEDHFKTDIYARQARRLKATFNAHFLIKDQGLVFPAQALDGLKTPIVTITGNPAFLLWASYSSNSPVEAILDNQYVKDLVTRLFASDLFDPDAGIRTMSTLSPTFNPNRDSYHNGSFWPKLNGLAYEGLINWGYIEEAMRLKAASCKPFEFFDTPVELYIKNADGKFTEYESPSGHKGCRRQAWSAAALLDLVTS
jgi:glycogen debranching enzyme